MVGMVNRLHIFSMKKIVVLSTNISICLVLVGLKCVRLDNIQYNQQSLADAITAMSVANANAIGL